MSPGSQNVSKNVSKIYTRTTNLGIFPELNIHLLNATGGTKPSRKLFAYLELLENQYIQGQTVFLKECLLKPCRYVSKNVSRKPKCLQKCL
jgi:hypothetical protein